MTYSEPVRASNRRSPKILVAGLLVAIAAIVPALGYQWLTSSPSTTASPVDAPLDRRPRVPGPRNEHPDRRNGHRGALGEAGGAVPDGTTVYDDEFPGVARLDPALLGALRQAATDAADDGVGLYVNSGWRSWKYQEQLFLEAVVKYGSAEEAARWVAPPGTSAHESGDAVDVEGTDAAAWLSAQGIEYGLCQIYVNEPWHFELHPEAIDQGCPAMYANPTQDPRLQQ